MIRKLALVDTNVVSYAFRGDSRGELYRPILRGFHRLGVSFQTVAELDFWAEKNGWGKRRRDDLELALRDFIFVAGDEATCRWWARVRNHRAMTGRHIHPEDAWIAATALTLGVPLITHDARDFDGIRDLEVITATERGDS